MLHPRAAARSLSVLLSGLVAVATLCAPRTRAGEGGTTMTVTPALSTAIHEMRQELTHMTHRSFTSDVPMTSLTESEVRQYLVGKLRQDYPGTAIADEQKAYVHFGLLKAGDDLEALFLGMLTEQAAGFYDPDRKSLFLVTGKPFPGIALVHELAHALQDQSYGLSRILDGARNNDDQLLAVQSLVEGEAMALSARFTLAHPSMTDGLDGLNGTATQDLRESLEKLGRMPPILQESLMFPYVQGMAWADAQTAAGGQERMDELFRKPPESSEQILHPDKSRTPRDLPSVIQSALLPDLSFSGFRTVKTNTLGEFNVTYLLGGKDDAEAVAAARGWDGDLYAVYEKPGGPTSMVWISAWDTALDARQFSDRARGWLARRHADSEEFRIMRRPDAGRVVCIIEGFGQALRAQIEDKVAAAMNGGVILR